MMTAFKKVKSHPDVVDILKSFCFITSTLKNQKLNIKYILLSKLPLYKELNVVKANHAFKGYAMSYKVEVIEKKVQLNSEKQVYQVLKACLVIL